MGFILAAAGAAVRCLNDTEYEAVQLRAKAVVCPWAVCAPSKVLRIAG